MSKAAAVPYDTWLDSELQDPEFASHYLNEAMASGDKGEFLYALGNLVRARGGIAKMADAIGMTRQALTRALARGGNPGYGIVYAIANNLNLVSSFHPRDKKLEVAGWDTGKRKDRAPADVVAAASNAAYKVASRAKAKRK